MNSGRANERREEYLAYYHYLSTKSKLNQLTRCSQITPIQRISLYTSPVNRVNNPFKTLKLIPSTANITYPLQAVTWSNDEPTLSSLPAAARVRKINAINASDTRIKFIKKFEFRMWARKDVRWTFAVAKIKPKFSHICRYSPEKQRFPFTF